MQATPVIRRYNRARGIGRAGRPIILPAYQTSLGGTETCHAVRGATNQDSTAYDPQARRYYGLTAEACSIYTKTHNGGVHAAVRNFTPRAQTVVRAFRGNGGKVALAIKLPEAPARNCPSVPGSNYAGTLTTVGGRLFYGEMAGAFPAGNVKTGRSLWHFQTDRRRWKGDPMTDLARRRQYVAIAPGPTIIAFALTP